MTQECSKPQANNLFYPKQYTVTKHMTYFKIFRLRDVHLKYFIKLYFFLSLHSIRFGRISNAQEYVYKTPAKHEMRSSLYKGIWKPYISLITWIIVKYHAGIILLHCSLFHSNMNNYSCMGAIASTKLWLLNMYNVTACFKLVYHT